jgi:inosine/xanthosine triphosphatase
MKIIIASLNPVKINAAKGAFTALWPEGGFDFIGVDVPSGVGEQPIGSDQTRLGALNRIANARKAHAGADYYIAFEGGVEETGTPTHPVMTSVIWVVTSSADGYTSPSRCVTFEIPPPIATLIRSGMTLGDADDQVFNRKNSKQQNGSIGIVTHDVLTRTSVYRDGAVMSLVPFVNPHLYGTMEPDCRPGEGRDLEGQRDRGLRRDDSTFLPTSIGQLRRQA